MGLDSVELLMEWEKYFDIEIPDLVAEKIGTVQEAVDAISIIMNIAEDKPYLGEKIFLRLKTAIINGGFAAQVEESSFVCEFIPEYQNQVWQVISKELDLEVPLPPVKPEGPLAKLFSIAAWVPRFNYQKLTFYELTDVICGANYKKLIDPKSISTKYEIYIILMGLTVEKIGIDYYEFKSEKSFTGDFGID
jgi:hypothetical protein